MNKHIDNIVKSIGRHKKGLRDPQIMHPEREWTIGIFLALLIFIASATWSLTLYLENRNAALGAPIEEQSESLVYRESMVAQGLTRLDERAKMLASLLPQTNQVQVEEVIEEVATSTESTIPPTEESTEDEVEPITEEVVEDESVPTMVE